jgi:hypothetical protein
MCLHAVNSVLLSRYLKDSFESNSFTTTPTVLQVNGSLLRQHLFQFYLRTYSYKYEQVHNSYFGP